MGNTRRTRGGPGNVLLGQADDDRPIIDDNDPVHIHVQAVADHVHPDYDLVLNTYAKFYDHDIDPARLQHKHVYHRADQQHYVQYELAPDLDNEFNDAHVGPYSDNDYNDPL